MVELDKYKNNTENDDLIMIASDTTVKGSTPTWVLWSHYIVCKKRFCTKPKIECYWSKELVFQAT